MSKRTRWSIVVAGITGLAALGLCFVREFHPHLVEFARPAPAPTPDRTENTLYCLRR